MEGVLWEGGLGWKGFLERVASGGRGSLGGQPRVEGVLWEAASDGRDSLRGRPLVEWVLWEGGFG